MEQTMNPTPSQLNQMMGGGPSCIVVICPPTHTQEEKGYIVVSADTLRLPNTAWQPLPLASRLGVDLLYAKPDNSQHPLFTVPGGANTTIAALTLDCDPASASFGVSAITSTSGVAFKYADPRKKIAKAVLQPLEAFVTERMTSIRDALAGPEDITGANEEYAKLGSKAFKTFWKEYRAQQARLHPGMGWAKIECSVTVTGTSCEACGKGADERDEVDVLMRCGKCRKVQYCGRHCQKEDWKAHKPFCSSK